MPRKPLTAQQHSEIQNFIDQYSPEWVLLSPQELSHLGADREMLLVHLCAHHIHTLNDHQMKGQRLLDSLNHKERNHVLARLAQKHRQKVQEAYADLWFSQD